MSACACKADTALLSCAVIEMPGEAAAHGFRFGTEHLSPKLTTSVIDS
jgi:hypothetical protein